MDQICLEIPPCVKKVVFVTEFAILGKILPFYEVRKKKICAWRNFTIIVSRPLFTITFRHKIVILGTDSILRVKTMYESVK